MRHTILLASAVMLVATPGFAAPGDRQAMNKGAGKPTGEMAAQRPTKTRQAPAAAPQRANAASQYQRPQPGTKTRPVAGNGYARPVEKSTTSRNINTNRPGSNTRPVAANNTVVTGNTIVVPGNNRYPVYRPPGGGYYRPPNGGYYRPPPPPPGGWGGGYYPPPRYQYDDGPSVGDVIAGVAVTGTLLYVLSEATKPKQQTVVQGGPPPMPPPPQPYVPPRNSTGAPATINVNLATLTPEARPAASVCITEASRQIGATGGTEIRIDRIVDVEPGNGGYRFRVDLLGVYPDETRRIPMYCRATPEKIVELTFG